ncbi:branched-chain amino acid ABC transporter substrate-binding protein [Afipia sp. Root123D2]|uniref:ABC transporter substrate-binding protein n=1 Tax=Afipia sp. Root123D2 TaxID=1736436 RepID=UPI0006F9F9EE|nr:ABC transporter substrate-binding protein [Afipia sp. Root123D2]KQW19467.1 branched-chain amino acid ABC transporter substrate-binding protein [Afipia sp. Root123D2]
MLRKSALAALLATALCAPALAGNAPGVTATEIKVGAIFPFSGPASALGNVGKALIAYVNLINDKGGVNGRKIDLITADDAYSPPKTVEHARRLVESDEVAFMFSTLGTPGNLAIAKYLAAKKVPQTFIVTGAARFTDAKTYPLITTALPSYDTESKAYARYIAKDFPDAKIAILYQNDDLGRDFVAGFKSEYNDAFDKKVVTSSYEVSQPTIDSQVMSLKSTGASVLLFAGTPKFAAQAIRKTHESGWKPLFITNLVSSSISSVLTPAGLDISKGVVTATYRKDVDDPRWADDAGVKQYKAFMEKYMPGADISESNYFTGMHQGVVLEALLKQCGNDLSRENIARQARNIKGLALPLSLPGIVMNTSATNNKVYTQLSLQRWNGKAWDLFGGIINDDSE